MKCHKIKYGTLGDARDALELMRSTERARRGWSKERPRRGRLNAYYCKVCNSWHLGHDPVRKK